MREGHVLDFAQDGALTREETIARIAAMSTLAKAPQNTPASTVE